MILARRRVAVDLAEPQRQCLYCLGAQGPFEAEEHVIPRRLGEATDRYVLEPGAVCDPCNHFLGQQVDAPFTNRFDIALTRGLEALSDRRGKILEIIEGRSATSRLDVQLEPGGPSVSLFASDVKERPDGGLDIEIEPRQRDPDDIVARTLRALWKIALGVIYLGHGRQVALESRWDDLRQVVLGAPFRGYLLQSPFQVFVTRRLDVNVDTHRSTDATAVTFAMGGVVLAAPLAVGSKVSRAELRARGWELKTTDSPVEHRVRLSLNPTEL